MNLKITVCFLAVAPCSSLANILSLGAGVSSFMMNEYSQSGHKMVEEHGFLPLLSLNYFFSVASEKPNFLAYFDYAGGKIDYDGQLQSGQRYKTKTDMALADILFAYRLPLDFNNQSIYVGYGWQYWSRSILPIGNAMKLNELYRSKSAVIVWQNDWQKIHLGAHYGYHFDSDLRISIPNYDEGNIPLPNSHRFKVFADFPLSTSWSITAAYSYRKIHRSQTIGLYKEGSLSGQMTQPEHNLQTVNLNLKHEF